MTILVSREANYVVLSPWGKAAAGALAAVMANSLVYPLDLAKTQLQVQDRLNAIEKPSGNEDRPLVHFSTVWDVLQDTYARNGLKGLYNGLPGSLIGTVSTNFAYFYWYSFFRGNYIRRYGTKSPLKTHTELLLGALAGAVAQIFTIPVSVITTRQQTTDQKFHAAAEEILSQDGVRGFWRGLKASLVLVINPSLTYGSSARLKTLLYGHRMKLSVPENFVLGAMSKSIATIITQPLIVAKVMQQSSRKFASFTNALIYLLKSGGFTALFKGLGPQISKGILVQGLLLAFKDKVEIYILSLLAMLRRPAIRAKTL